MRKCIDNVAIFSFQFSPILEYFQKLLVLISPQKLELSEQVKPASLEELLYCLPSYLQEDNKNKHIN